MICATKTTGVEGRMWRRGEVWGSQYTDEYCIYLSVSSFACFLGLRFLPTRINTDLHTHHTTPSMHPSTVTNLRS